MLFPSGHFCSSRLLAPGKAATAILVGVTALTLVSCNPVTPPTTSREGTVPSQASPPDGAAPRIVASPSPKASPLATSPPVKPSSPPTASPTPVSPPVAAATLDRPADSSANDRIIVESCVIKTVKTSDPDPPVNIRSSPEVKPDNIVDKLNNNVFLTIVTSKGDWLQVTRLGEEKTIGWISRNLVQSSCNQKTAQIRLTANEPTLQIADYFVGNGSHQYRLKVEQGQTLTITSQLGPLPVVSTAEGQFLGGGEQAGQTWTGKVPSSGNYLISLDSNFKGYDYEFTVQVK